MSKPLLFSHFGSKAELFDAAVVAPISEFVADYVASWQTGPDMPPEERVEHFVSGLFDLARDNRTILMSAVTRRMQHGSRSEHDVLDQLAGTLQGVRGVHDVGQYPDVDPAALSAVAVGMVFGVALLDDLLFASGTRRPGRARLVAEMSKVLFHGATGRPDKDRSNE